MRTSDVFLETGALVLKKVAKTNLKWFDSWVINRVWLLHSSLGICFKKKLLFYHYRKAHQEKPFTILHWPSFLIVRQV